MLYLLDTNYLTILQRGGEASQRLQARLDQIEPSAIATTIISYHEQMRGWLSRANSFQQAKPIEQVKIYQSLEENRQIFSEITVVGFDLQAAEEYQQLRKLHRKTGSMDLRIAAIAITQGATLLSQNLVDFKNIQKLQVEDWSR
jgi:tRNA(fMet)-specific endonuclease VapC